MELATKLGSKLWELACIEDGVLSPYVGELALCSTPGCDRSPAFVLWSSSRWNTDGLAHPCTEHRADYDGFKYSAPFDVREQRERHSKMFR